MASISAHGNVSSIPKSRPIFFDGLGHIVPSDEKISRVSPEFAGTALEPANTGPCNARISRGTRRRLGQQNKILVIRLVRLSRASLSLLRWAVLSIRRYRPGRRARLRRSKRATCSSYAWIRCRRRELVRRVHRPRVARHAVTKTYVRLPPRRTRGRSCTTVRSSNDGILRLQFRRRLSRGEFRGRHPDGQQSRMPLGRLRRAPFVEGYGTIASCFDSPANCAPIERQVARPPGARRMGRRDRRIRFARRRQPALSAVLARKGLAVHAEIWQGVFGHDWPFWNEAVQRLL